MVIIPAKSSSSRVPDKNSRPFTSTSNLTGLLAEKLTSVGLDVVIDTDVPDLFTNLKSPKVSIHHRSAQVSHSETPIEECIADLLSVSSSTNFYVCNSNSPLVPGSVYLDAIKKFEDLDNEYDSILIVTEVHKMMYDSHYKPLNFEELNTSKLAPMYSDPCVLWGGNRLGFMHNRKQVWGTTLYYMMDRKYELDINYVWEFERAQREVNL